MCDQNSQLRMIDNLRSLLYRSISGQVSARWQSIWVQLSCLLLTINSANVDRFFTVKFRKDLWRKMELKLSPPLKSVAHYRVKSSPSS